MPFLNTYNLIPATQFGFFPRRSTEQTIYTFLHHLFKNLDKGKETIAIYYDLLKTFDTINH